MPVANMTNGTRARLKTVGTSLSVNSRLAALTVTSMMSTGANICCFVIIACTPAFLNLRDIGISCVMNWMIMPLPHLLLALLLRAVSCIVARTRKNLKTQNIYENDVTIVVLSVTKTLCSISVTTTFYTNMHRRRRCGMQKCVTTSMKMKRPLMSREHLASYFVKNRILTLVLNP